MRVLNQNRRKPWWRMETVTRVSSLAEFFYELKKIRRRHVHEFRSLHASSLTFYRGQSGYGWTPAPRLYREKMYLHEQELIAESLRIAPDEFAGKTDFQRLATMQHFGLPTRLLDVTSNPLVALFFACHGSPEASGEVLVFPNLPTFREDNYAVRTVTRFACFHSWQRLDEAQFFEDAEPLLPRVFGAERNLSERLDTVRHTLQVPYHAVLSDFVNQRLTAQSGSFLLFGMKEVARVVSQNPGTRGRQYVDFEPVVVEREIGLSPTGLGRSGALSITIPSEAKSAILDELDEAGVSLWRIFPETEYKMRYVYEKYASGAWHGFHGWKSKDPSSD